MESYMLDIQSRNSGTLLQNKTFVSVNGPLLTVSNNLHGKSVNFLHAAWNQYGTKIAAGDALGNVYIFHLNKNRFSLVNSLRTCCTFLTFTNDKTQDVLVALADCSIVSLNSDLKIQRNNFGHHTSCVSYISFDKGRKTVLSCSKDQAILWDLETFRILRVLTLKRSADIIKVFFLPDKDIIVSAFSDNSVFLWNLGNFSCVSQFVCSYNEEYLNTKTLDASVDGKLIACAGKVSWFMIWSVQENEKICSISLPENFSFVKQLNFLPFHPDLPNDYVLCLLSGEGEVVVYNVSSFEILYRLKSLTGKIISFANALCHHQTVAISLQGVVEFFDLCDLFKKPDETIEKKTIKIPEVFKEKLIIAKKKKTKAKIQKYSPEIEKQKLLAIVKKFGEFPERHRFFIWAQLLELPHNVDAFKLLNQESLKTKPLVKDYSFMNPGVQKTFLCLMSMIFCWHPVIQEMEFFQCLLFPFIKVLHKNTIACFELMVSLISNWCQYWFLFIPFQPHNILCIVENILSYHDRDLMVHFTKNKLSNEVYAWSLLKTSFSEVFNKQEWLKLWDNIFANPLPFQLYTVAAYSISIRNVLLRSTTKDQFKECYRRHLISASVVIKKAYELQESSSDEVSPKGLVGTFRGIPKGIYPTFFQMSQIKLDLKDLRRKKLLDQEVAYLKRREDALEVKSTYLKELQDLQMLRRKLLLESLNLKNIEAKDSLNKKLISVQTIIQDNLYDQIAMLKCTIGENSVSQDKMDFKKTYFEFQDLGKKLKKKRK